MVPAGGCGIASCVCAKGIDPLLPAPTVFIPYVALGSGEWRAGVRFDMGPAGYG